MSHRQAAPRGTLAIWVQDLSPSQLFQWTPAVSGAPRFFPLGQARFNEREAFENTSRADIKCGPWLSTAYYSKSFHGLKIIYMCTYMKCFIYENTWDTRHLKWAKTKCPGHLAL